MLHDLIAARLAGDATLMATLTGGVWSRALARNQSPTGMPATPGSTPGAFDVAADGSSGRLRPAAVVGAPNEVGHPSGKRGPDALAWDAFVQVHLYAPATATGKAAIETADGRIQALLHGWMVPGSFATVEALTERVGPIDSDEFPGSVQTYRRFRTTGVRLIERVA